MQTDRVIVLGAGLAGACTALLLARRGTRVDLVDRNAMPIGGASLHNEGKLHLGYVYAADPEARTHEILAEGSRRFLDIVSSLTDCPPCSFRLSRPFVYGVPIDSQVRLDDLRTHFARVDGHVAQRALATSGPSPARSRELGRGSLAASFDPHRVQAAFATDEVAVDPRQVASRVRTSIFADKLIRFHASTKVLAARAEHGGFRIDCAAGGTSRSLAAPVVVNCLWEERLRVDATVGLPPEPPTLLRYKAAISLSVPSCPLADRLPSTTLVLGPYGDLVNLGDGRYYLSWYPSCKLGESASGDPRGLHELLRQSDRERIVRDSVKGLSAFMPLLGALPIGEADVSVGGGVIAAHATSDITDPESGLHRRSRIGPRAHGAWITLDTGKYCTAPMFAEKAAELALAALGGEPRETWRCPASHA